MSSVVNINTSFSLGLPIYFILLESESEVTQSCLTLCDPADYSLPGFSIHGILQARILGWIAITSSRESSRTRDWTCVSSVSCIGRWVLYHQHHNVLSLFQRRRDWIGRGNWGTGCWKQNFTWGGKRSLPWCRRKGRQRREQHPGAGNFVIVKFKSFINSSQCVGLEWLTEHQLLCVSMCVHACTYA